MIHRGNQLRRLERKRVSIRPSELGGYGVFADEFIPQGEIVEECPYLYTDAGSAAINELYFVEPHRPESQFKILPLGDGALFNHDDAPNMSHILDEDIESIVFTALRDIRPDEELTYNYGEGWLEDRLQHKKGVDIKNSYPPKITSRANQRSIMDFLEEEVEEAEKSDEGETPRFHLSPEEQRRNQEIRLITQFLAVLACLFIAYLISNQ